MEPNYGYKHTKGFLLFVLIVVFMAIGAAYAQTSPNTPSGYSIDNQTGNLIANGGITSATGWTVTAGSPTWTPVSPGGVFDADGYTYSYGRESLGQAGISLGSFNHGYLNSGAVFVTGFSYGLTYRFPCANSVGTNCDGTSQTAAPANPVQDNLRVEVGYYPSTGNPTFYTHPLGLKNINDGNPAYNPNWQTLAETVTFAGAKPLAQAGSVNFEIIGNDAGNWACLNGTCYGPQVKNAYIRANYSVDPCILNPAFNPNCPGFNNVIQGWASPTYWNSYNIATTLPHIGGGVQLHGFDYGFSWTNYGSCYASFLFWCTDWRTDGGGNVNFRVSDKNNTTLYYDQQYRAGNNQSGTYSNRFLFTETRNSLDLGSVQWWTDSVWNNFWVAGWTRPIWTPDPCYFNGLYSPNCSNFQDTLKQVMADIKAQQEKISAQNASVSSSTPAPGGTITTTIVADSVNPSVVVTTEPNQPLTTAQVTQSSREQTQSSTTSLALSLIRNNDRREQGIVMQASRTAVEQASQQAQRSQQEAQSVAESAQQEGQRLSMAAADQAQQTAQQSFTQSESRTNTQASSLVSMMPNTAPVILQQPSSAVAVVRFDAMQEERRDTAQSQQLTLGAASPIMLPPAMAAAQSQETRPITPSLPNLSSQTMLTAIEPRPEQGQSYTPPPQTFALPEQPRIEVASISRPIEVLVLTIPSPSVNMFETALPQMPQPQPVEVRTQESETATSPANFITNRTNPITEIVENRPRLLDTAPRRNELETVNKSAPNNELAGGVSIESIAIAPQGFNVYASLVLRDAAFYAPKEIYRGQRNVDNVRALRNLAQDARHQEMIDQQYRR